MLLRGALLGLALGPGSAAEQRQRRGSASKAFEVVWNSWYQLGRTKMRRRSRRAR